MNRVEDLLMVIAVNTRMTATGETQGEAFATIKKFVADRHRARGQAALVDKTAPELAEAVAAISDAVEQEALDIENE